MHNCTATTSSSNLLLLIPPRTTTMTTLSSPQQPANFDYVNKSLFMISKAKPTIPQSNLLHKRHFTPSAVPSSVACSNYDDDEGEDEEAAAVEAVSQIIYQFGGRSILKEESYEMALNSPNYTRMLVDSVRELNELEIGISNSDSKEEQKSFREKVYEMGIQKGDMGIVPFLESVVGLSIPFAMHLSRSCISSQQMLPQLIVEVKFVKEVLYSDTGDGDEGHIGEIARRMMRCLSIPVDDDALQQTLSFYEKIQARRGGLNMLGSGDASFSFLIQSFPRLLLLPLESRVMPVVKFLGDIGVPKSRLRYILLLYPPILFYDIEKDIKPAFAKVGAENKDWGRILLKYPWILSTSIQKNYGEILSLVDTKKVPKVSVDRAIKSWPYLLGCSIDKLKLMVNEISEMGISNKKLGQVIAKSPQLLLQKPLQFQQVVFFLKELGVDDEFVARTLGRCPEIFASDIETTLKKKLEFVLSIGVSKGHLPRVIRKYPELFVCDIDKALLPRINYLIKIGLSKRDIAFMVGRFSPILGYSIKEVLEPKSEFLMNTMERPLRDVVDYPRYFSYSLEKKIKPRFWELKSRNLECSLQDMLHKNDEEFAADFMSVERMLGPP